MYICSHWRWQYLDTSKIDFYLHFGSNQSYIFVDDWAIQYVMTEQYNNWLIIMVRKMRLNRDRLKNTELFFLHIEN